MKKNNSSKKYESSSEFEKSLAEKFAEYKNKKESVSDEKTSKKIKDSDTFKDIKPLEPMVIDEPKKEASSKFSMKKLFSNHGGIDDIEKMLEKKKTEEAEKTQINSIVQESKPKNVEIKKDEIKKPVEIKANIDDKDVKENNKTLTDTTIKEEKKESPDTPPKEKLSFKEKLKSILPKKKTGLEKIKEELDKENKNSLLKKEKEGQENKELKKDEHKKGEEKHYLSTKELYLKKQQKKKVVFTHHERKRHLKDYLEKAGYSVNDETNISRKVTITAIVFISILMLYILYAGIAREDRFLFILIQILMSWAILLPGLIVIFWVVFYFVIDFKIYNRRKELEEVLPDFLQLTSANINAGMPLDQALWYAVRPRFGILAKEIEEVAKSTLVGEDLGDALIKFSKRYDSPMLKRTVNLMLEGLQAGGEIGPLLNKISIDIQETRIMKKDMAANVTTYVIFISFATLTAAPFLFALSYQLLTIITNLVSKINIPQGSGGGISLSMSADAISISNFNIFAISALIMTSFFSAVIVSTIKYGNVRDGIKYVPIYIGVTVTIYLIAVKVLGFFLGGII